VVTNCTANQDAEPLTVMTITDGAGNPLSQLGANVFVLPKTMFVNGVAQIHFTTTKADTGVYISVVPSTGGLNTIGEPMDFAPGPVTNFRTEIVPATPPNIVYLMRKYELRLTPRDRFNNPNPSEMILSRLTARYPGEFSAADGGAGLFAGEVFIQGTTNYFLTSSQPRTNQEIICYASADPNLRGSTGQYVVADHAPGAFSLIRPVDKSTLQLMKSTDTIQFLWQPSKDPYENILLGNQTMSDPVTYTIVLADSATKSLLLEFPSHNSGAEPDFTVTHQLARAWMLRFNSPVLFGFEWYVRATDGLYVTRSSDTRILRLFFPAGDDVDRAIPAESSLSQNFPNPFTSTTTIGFNLTARGFVTLDIVDPIGRSVARLVSEERDAGHHAVLFDGRALPAGAYLCRLTVPGRSLTRMIALTK
jgi:hypothetical protein